MDKAQDNLFSESAADYKQYRPKYPPELFQYLISLVPATRLAWDCGCGNGQATAELAKYFHQVNASDISKQQLAEAPAFDNVHYSISPAEKIAAANNSLDLVTVAQAIHWFDHKAFFAEVDRVLKPGGIITAWGYQLLYSNSPLDEVIERLHSEIVGPYWPKGREFLDESYSKISFPYPRLPIPTFAMQCRWRMPELLGYLNTWSAVKAYRKDQDCDPISFVREDIVAAWGEPDKCREIFWPLILYIGRKPHH